MDNEKKSLFKRQRRTFRMKTINLTISDKAHFNILKKQEELSVKFNRYVNMPETVDIILTELYKEEKENGSEE